MHSGLAFCQTTLLSTRASQRVCAIYPPHLYLIIYASWPMPYGLCLMAYALWSMSRGLCLVFYVSWPMWLAHYSNCSSGYCAQSVVDLVTTLGTGPRTSSTQARVSVAVQHRATRREPCVFFFLSLAFLFFEPCVFFFFEPGAIFTLKKV